MAEWKDLRNYEISVWTIQDNYITTLKSGDPLFVSEASKPAVWWPQARAQGQIQNGQMQINIDGTQTLSFDIPMYLYVNGEKIENPNWYNTTNKNILTSMRKVKVIFNKWDEDKELNKQKIEIIEYFNGANGNVNLYSRPRIQNDNGTYSTLLTSVYTIGNMIVSFTPIPASGDNLLYTMSANGLVDLSLLDAYVAELAALNPKNISDLLAKDKARKALIIRAVTTNESSVMQENYWAKKLHTIAEQYEQLKLDGNAPVATAIETYRANNVAVFEFLIVKVSEVHESDNLTCHVECEGLAFHELGKVGYKRSLSTTEFNDDYYNWSITTESDYTAPDYKAAHKPVANLQYWMSKAQIDPKPANVNDINPTAWYYEIRMAHTSLVHEKTVYDDKIYEEGFATDWDDNGTPLNYIQTREKARLVDINESNLYNITQDLAEKFEVFCRYEYTYDNNYNIIGRTIIFYNNFLQESKDVTTLMYPNSASRISREMDSTDITTKMFVRSVETADLYTGQINIMDCTANKSREDYLLNFDYLHDIGTISDEQYAAISKYETTMKKLNKKIIPLQEAWSNLQTLKTDVDALVTVYTNSIQLDEERITENAALLYALDVEDGDNDGYITRDYRNPETLSLIKDSSDTEYDNYYVQLNQNDKCRGIQPETLKLYKTYNTTTAKSYSYALSFNSFKEDNVSSRTINLPSNTYAYDNTSWFDYELVYKGTIGKSDDKPNTTSLPSASSSKGWIYKVITENRPSGYSTVKGDLFISNGSTWDIFKLPSGKKSKNGFFIYKRQRVQQINGPITEICNCTRKGHESVTTDYISRVRNIYYTSSTSINLTAPTVESATTAATAIGSKNVLGEWTSYLSTPDGVSSISGYYFYYCTEIAYSQGKKVYTTPSSIDSDVTNVSIDDAVSNAAARYLQNEVTGTFVYDDYGNLDRVTGLFQRSKQGSYFTYGISEDAVSFNSINSYSGVTSTINDSTNGLSTLATGNTFPTDKKNKYVIIREQQYYSNGNVVYAYSLKYYGSDEIMVTPNNGQNIVKTIEPIFYLRTDESTLPVMPNSNYQLTVKREKSLDTWTTVMPDKTKSSQTYYSGWMVTAYNGDTKCFVYASGNTPAEDTSLKKKKKGTTDEEGSVPKYIYATFKYKPDLYYEKIKASWEQKLYEDNQDLQKNESRKAALKTLIDDIKSQLDEQLEEKNKQVLSFEHMMGAALREGYWQPGDEYQDYGTKYEENLVLFMSNLYTQTGATFFTDKTNNNLASIGWDGVCFDEEQKLYYESSINKTQIYYPCIDLSLIDTTMSGDTSAFLGKYRVWATSGSKKNPYAFFFNPTKKIIPEGESTNDIRYCQYYTIGSTSKLEFVRINGVIKPVLLLLNASSLSDDELQNMYSNGRLGQLKPTKKSDGTVVLKMNKSTSYTIPAAAWVNVSWDGNKWVQKANSTLKQYEVVYPRILIPSLKLKTDSKTLILKYGDATLKEYDHFYILTKTYYKNTSGIFIDDDNPENPITYIKTRYDDLETISESNLSKTSKFLTYYTITIKPDYLFAHAALEGEELSNLVFKLFFAISNADLDIYLDARKIIKENAYPKVSYDIEVSKWSPSLLKNLYNKLAQLVMINDTDLKFQNTFGYISQITLDLDHEEKDAVQVKNYKTKFEDLFSKIVAETEEMHKNSYNIGMAGALASGDSVPVTLSPEGFSSTIQDAANKTILESFLNEYFDGSEVVRKKTKELFNEAGEILASAATSLNSVLGTTTANATILSGFRENVTAALTPTIFTGPNPPMTFKPGDIWINDEDNYRAIATGYSGRSSFTRTYDGKLAEIAGTSLNIDAVSGAIDIIGETQINLMSGKNVYIAAGDTVDIVGNKAVNIGGTTINMASCNIIGDGYPGQPGEGGIHLVATDYVYVEQTSSLNEGSVSRVDVHGEGIELASKKGIVIKSGEGIKIYSSNQDNETALDNDHGTAAVKINATDGIWLGSNKPLSLYSGDVVLNDDGTIASGSTGANVELNSAHLLLGVANVDLGQATAIELSDQQIMLAAGSELHSMLTNENNVFSFDNPIDINKITDSNLAGVQIKSNYIGMATGQNTYDETEDKWTINRSIISMDPGIVKLGQMRLVDSNHMDDPESYEGSYMWLSNNQIYIGGMGSLTLNTNNIKIQTTNLTDPTANSTEVTVSKMGFCLGKNLQGVDEEGAAADPLPMFGFWIDTNDVGHLVVDADFIRLGHDGVIDSVSLSETIPVETVRLYRAHNMKTVGNEPTPNNYVWGQLSTTDLTSQGWTAYAPPAATIGSGTNVYIWSTTQFKYASGSANGQTTYKYKATLPKYEDLINNIGQITHKEYKYAQAIPAADSAGWSLSIPSLAEASYTYEYRYSGILCSKQSNITANVNLTASSGTADYQIRQVTKTDVSVTFSRFSDEEDIWKTVTEKCKNKDWFIWLDGYWRNATGQITIKKKGWKLYSRKHVILENGEHTYYDVTEEAELASLSEAARDAWNIANGTYPVPSVSSSGLSIDGDNVVLGSTGKLMLLGNGEVFVGTSSSNSALRLYSGGISIGSQGEIAINSSKGIWIGNIVDDQRVNSIELKPSGLKIYTTATVDITSSNFCVNSIAKGVNRIFFVGIDQDNLEEFDSDVEYAAYTYIKYDHNIYQFTAKHNIGTTWENSSKTSALTSDKIPDLSFSLKNGLVVTGAIHATSLYVEGTNGSEWVNSKILPGTIWQGVQDATANSSFLKITSTSIQVGSTGSIIIGDSNSNGTLKVNTTNVIINTVGTAGTTIFQLKNGSTDYLKISKDSNGSITAKIGGWTISNGLLYSGSESSYVGLSSNSSSSGSYAIWCGDDTASSANFAVKRNGDTYMNSLMIYDPQHTIGTSAGVYEGDYIRINFSSTNFNNAISLKSGGSWSGNTFNATLQLWGKINKSVGVSASAEVVAATVTAAGDSGKEGKGDILVDFKVNDGDTHLFVFEDIPIAAWKEYKNGWEMAAMCIGYQQGSDVELVIPDKTSYNHTTTFSVQHTYNVGWNEAVAAFGTVYTLISGSGVVGDDGYTRYRVSQKTVATK